MKRLGVLGTLVLDTIIPHGGGEPTRALGGVSYALSAWETEPAEGWEVFPLVKVGRDVRERADDFLDRLATLASRRGVRTVPEPNNRVELRYGPDGERTERLTGGVPGWTWGELAPLARACDALYVNLVAGWEVDLDVARRLGDAISGPLYCDLHSLLLERTSDGVRRRRAPEHWRAWTGCFHHLQLNREELRTLADDEGSEPEALARELGGRTAGALFVTLGAEGAAWYADAGDGTSSSGRVPTEPVEGGDPTGCGDAWGAACTARLLEGRPPGEAAAAANAVARRNVLVRGGAGLLAARDGSTPGRPDGPEGSDGGPGGPG